MKIKYINLKNFKRFTDLTIESLPENARLVVLIGPNGCGKSSLFDAFLTQKRSYQGNFGVDEQTKNYYNKDFAMLQNTYDINQRIQIKFYKNSSDQKKNIYIRSAYRNESEFQISGLQRVDSVLNEFSFHRMTQNDLAVSKNYQRLCSDAVEKIFEDEDKNKTIGTFREEVVDEIRQSMKRLFDNPTLILNTLGNPLKDGTFRFNKGDSKNFSYQNLSAGEKASFDLLLDVFIKKNEFNDTVFCIDEPEAHISTKLQGKLLEELYNLISENSQLWIATHSIGMMRKSYELWKKDSNAVVFLDFNHDFDKLQILKPIIPNRTFWEKTYKIALGDLSDLVAPNKIILCEGNPSDAERGFDADCYNQIFEKKYPDTLFISVGGCTEIEKSKENLIPVIKAITKGVRVGRLIDRDDNSTKEVQNKEAEGIFILKRRNIESYILDDEVLKALCKKHNKEDKTKELLDKKNT